MKVASTTPPSLFGGMSEVMGVLKADLNGGVHETTAAAPGEPEQKAAVAAAVVTGFAASGSAAGFTRLEMLLIKGSRSSTVTAVRPDVFMLVTLDHTKSTGPVEKALQAWASDATRTTPVSAAPSASAPGLSGLAASAPVLAPPSPAASAAGLASEAPRSASGPDPWAALRRALVRGQLTKASAQQRELLESSQSGAGIPGSEVLEPAEHEHAMQVLLDGIGTVIAGDGVSGSRILRELTAASQRNLSVRWLALQWSASAALRSGSSPVARSHVKEALTLARQLDIDARAVSQWTAAEVLAQGGDHARALNWLNEARARFERIGDRWGLGRTWLAEARIMASIQREQEGAEAARKAWAVDPAWDEPPIFLARLAVMRDDVAEAESIVRIVNSPAADRVRALIEAIREGTVTQTDASEFLREHDAPPSTHAVHALERIADGSPRFVQARDALAWMLLKLGKYAEASTIFRELLAQDLAPADRASVMLGLGCIPASPPGDRPESGEEVSLDASGATPPAAGPAGEEQQPQASKASGSNGSGPNAVFSGRLSVFALPDLLEFLRSARRSGLLVCSSPAGMGTLRFHEGWIIGASSPSTPKLGQLLVDAGKLSAQAAEEVASRQSTDAAGHLIGEILVKEGLADAAAVQEALRHQIELTIRELVQWKNGEFAFNREGEGQHAGVGVTVELDSQAVLLNVFKEMDEASKGANFDVELLRP